MAFENARVPRNTASERFWRLRKTVADDILLFALWLLLAFAVYRLTFPITTPTFGAPYYLFVLYSTRLYFHVLTVSVLAGNTVKVLKRARQIRPSCGPDDPRFLILIAAYKAQGTILSVIETLRYQDYPEDRLDVYVITQDTEDTDKAQRYEIVKNKIALALTGKWTGEAVPDAEIRLLAEVLKRTWMEEPDAVGDLKALATAYLCFRENLGKTASRLVDELVEAYFRHIHQGSTSEEFQGVLRRTSIDLSNRDLHFLELCARESLGAANRVILDFSRILELPETATIFRDPLRPVRMALRLTSDRPILAFRLNRIKRTMRRQIGAFVSTVADARDAYLKDILLTSAWNEQLAAAYNQWEETSPSMVERAVREIGQRNFHHICRKSVEAGKALSLNAAYDRILGENAQWLKGDTHVIVIDADSLLPTSALAILADEILNDADRNVIRQVAPFSTANYPGNNVFVKMICCIDTIGTMGKWAVNTRALTRPDLPAGSGLVIPVTLLEYLRRTNGTPWQTSTITEDARLVITDFGLLDGVSRKTKFVPIHMLEAVPEAPGIWQTIKQYWTQRMRWASGGPEEVLQILKAFRDERVYVESNRADGSIVKRRPGSWGRVRIRGRQLWFMYSWLSDHLWWGFGFGLAPVVWMVFAFFNITPVAFNAIGLLLMLGAPALVIFGFFRRYSSFVPGGLGPTGLFRLYLGTVSLAWFHTWPIIHTQFLYLIGKRNRFRKWKTTAKPRV